MLVWVYLIYLGCLFSHLYICLFIYLFMVGGTTEIANVKATKIGWVEQRKLLILRCEEVIKKIIPCSTSKAIAEIEYETGLSNVKAKEMLNIFVNKGFIKINSEKEVILNDE